MFYNVKITANNNWVLAVSLFLVLVSPCSTQAGELKGTISFEGRPPFAALLYAVNGQQSQASALIDQKDREFTQRMVVSGVGREIAFQNSDDVDHNIYANDIKNKASFDVGLMPPGSSSKVTADWNENVLVRIGCKIHPKMRSYIATVNSKHYQVLEFNKNAKTFAVAIAQLPDDASTFKLMLPKYDTLEVSLAIGESKTVTITKKGRARGTMTLQRL